MLAIVYVLQKWQGFIKGSPILVHADHKSLKYFLTQKNHGWWLACFMDDIAHFDVEIIYRPGKHQLVADALLCRKGHCDLPNSEMICPLFAAPMNPFNKEWDHLAIFQTFTEYKWCLQHGEESATIGNGMYTVKDDILYKWICNPWGEEIEVQVPTMQETVKNIIRQLHHKLGHLGAQTMLAALQICTNIPYLGHCWTNPEDLWWMWMPVHTVWTSGNTTTTPPSCKWTMAICEPLILSDLYPKPRRGIATSSQLLWTLVLTTQ